MSESSQNQTEKPVSEWSAAELALALKAMAFSMWATDKLGRQICDEAAKRISSQQDQNGNG